MDKEFSGFRRVVRINIKADVLLLIPGVLVNPDASQDFRLPSDGSEPVDDVLSSFPKVSLLNRAAVVIPGGQDYLVTSERHRPGSLCGGGCRAAAGNPTNQGRALAQ